MSHCILSNSPCSRRITQLEEQGIIRKRVAVLDHARLGMEVIAFINVSCRSGIRGSVSLKSERVAFGGCERGRFQRL